ncbi:MAG: T9SS type A sorting domain-containing protein, partial [Flavobacteriales bacterium]
FARVALRVDTAGASWQTAGGFGVYYPTQFVNKFGLQSGESYRAQGRTFCDSNITSYRSWWTSPIFWTQPGSIRLNGGTVINNLDVYPNPTRDIFNVSFVSEEIQTLSIRVLNIVGEVIYEEYLEEFVGEYTKQISLLDYSRGVYFLEINDTKGTINKKIILQ